MAAKSKVAPKGSVKPVSKVTAKAKAKPRGLQLSAAQFKAYTKAYNASSRAAYQKIALGAAARRFRKYRLNSAYATMKQAQVATGKAQRAAIAAFATRQSWRQAKAAHQNSALNARIEMDMYTHQNIAGRMQFAQGGVKAYSTKAVLRTLDLKQALSYEEAVFAKMAKIAKVAKKSVSNKGKGGTRISPKVKAQIAAVSKKAGLAAAAATPKGTAKRSPPKKAAAPKAVQAKPAKGKGAQSAKAPVKQAKSRAAPRKGVLPPNTFDGNGHWILGGNEFEGTCIMTAVANALYHQTRWRLPDEDIAYWTGRAGKHPTIGGVLNMLWTLQPWPQVELLQPIPLVACYEVFCNRIIGFGDHAAYAFGAQMVSYGELQAVVEADEVCTLEFRAR